MNGEPVDKVWVAKCAPTMNNVFVLFWVFFMGGEAWEGVAFSSGLQVNRFKARLLRPYFLWFLQQ